MSNEQARAAASRIAKEARSSLSPAIRERSGRVLYTPVATLFSDSPIYFLGIYPGFAKDSCEPHNWWSIEDDLLRLENDKIDEHAYLDECWGHNEEAGQEKLQKRILDVFAILAGGEQRGRQLLRKTPASNMIFLRKNEENGKLLKSTELLQRCWRFHETIISTKKPELVLTYAVTHTRKLARILNLELIGVRPSGLGALPNLYAWQMKEDRKLLAIPSLSQFHPGGDREVALRSFFHEFAPKWVQPN